MQYKGKQHIVNSKKRKWSEDTSLTNSNNVHDKSVSEAVKASTNNDLTGLAAYILMCNIDPTKQDLEEGSICILVVDCPDMYSIDPVVNDGHINCYLEDYDYIYHMTNSLVSKSERYCAWLSTFPDSSKHIFLHSDDEKSVFRSSNRAITQLHACAPRIFPLPSVYISSLGDVHPKDYYMTKYNISNGSPLEILHILPVSMEGNIDVSSVAQNTKPKT